MEFKFGLATDVGRKRSQNQDCSAAMPELGLFLVSDGMGGHQGGETASTTAVASITEWVKNALTEKSWEPVKVITEAFQEANRAIFRKAVDEPKLQGMGTTTTALLFKDRLLTIGHVGDSRCYFFRPKMMWQITRDHSLVQEKLRAGLISREDVKTDRMKNVITRSVGFENKVNIEIFQMEVNSGDCFVVCSDGLSGMMDDSVIQRVVEREYFEQGEADKTVKALIATANANGGDDNVTAILVQVV